jgi:hypothetical protein
VLFAQAEKLSDEALTAFLSEHLDWRGPGEPGVA